MYLTRTPELIQRLFPSFLCRVSGAEKEVYLTFDDGPIPEVTPWVLDQLAQYDARATFFCVGDNVRKHPDVFRHIQIGGHQVGNHTFNHLDGWATKNEAYLSNVYRCEPYLESTLFRPPYGRMCPGQVSEIQKRYHIVMWDVLSGDFDTKLSGESCLKNVLENVRPGSIVVFHDSIKAWSRLSYALPRVLEYYSQRGFVFRSLEFKKEALEQAIII